MVDARNQKHIPTKGPQAMDELEEIRRKKRQIMSEHQAILFARGEPARERNRQAARKRYALRQAEKKEALKDYAGPSIRAINVIKNAGAETLDDIRRLGLAHFKKQSNCGKKTLQEIGALIGGWDALP
jgi:DNA-directed RNA polymerase alpha subunit